MDEAKNVDQPVFTRMLNPSVAANPFGANKSGERVYRRAERIVAATFLLTNHMSECEPLRGETRSAAIGLLPQILDLRDEMRSSTSPKLIEFEASIRHLVSLVRILVFGGFVSAQNAEVIIGALDELCHFLSASVRTALSDTSNFSKEDFIDVLDTHKGHIRDKKDSIKDKPREMSDTALSAREHGIVSILKMGGELNIRDIASHLPEYGEKTIQRGLGALIEKGVVRRRGLKRWSRYSLSEFAPK